MKISQEEIDAAWDHASITWHIDTKRFMERALEAAYGVRKQRKAAKRERQRKEKDKQVVESVKATSLFAGMFGQDDWKAEKAKAWGNLAAMAGISSAVQSRNEPNTSKASESVKHIHGAQSRTHPLNIEHAKNFLRSSQLNAVFAPPSKAPEWDGTFGVGCYEARNGRKATIAYKEGNYLYGSIMDFDGYRWTLTGSAGEDWHMYDLIRPWPKGEQ